ncbi:MAG: response regulator, partial [Lachnospiraceae bacterium]|nr:response regulator [Lachnospiraceae bacterium]
VIILLIGVYDLDAGVFNVLCSEYKDTPVLTIGTQRECDEFSTLFMRDDFENLLRPLDNADVLSAACRLLDIPVPNGKAAQETVYDSRRHILVVDDNPLTLRNLKSILEDHYKVSLANSGMKAMTSIGKERPDLILLDYEMPVCDGRQTLEMIKADEEMCDIPVIFLTGVNDREHIEAVLKLQPAGYLLKPVVQDMLLEKIEQAITDSEQMD